ncbi:DUF4142 domain-containing protein [Caulobacter sp. S45]|uniref:DUF4142 domain-containing protein n=1 Tax=Caulobacter sp. S45 TaxID=1641861 RepID=UPI00157729BE|nr:DUF4142 domain-containing protein [Caulobacter sp. S45]
MPNAQVFVAAGLLAVMTGVQPSGAQPPAPMSARDFVKAASASDQYEIQAARVAEVESRDGSVRAFARKMIQDHTRTRQALQQASLASGMPPPPDGMNDDGQKLLSQLQSLRAPDFDRAYVRQQVLSHQEALVVEQGYAADGSDPNLRRTAASAVPIVQHHLDMARRLQP